MAGYPCGHPAKNFGQALQILEKQAFWNGHPVRTSMKKLRSEKLRADFPFPNHRKSGEESAGFSISIETTSGLWQTANSLAMWVERCEPLFSNTPKGPSRTKSTTDSKFTIRSKFATAIVKRYGGHFETTIFKGKLSSKSLQIVKNYGSSKTLRN